MTRVNLVAPQQLTDQHLFAEYREITRLFVQVKNALDKYPAKTVLAKIPPTYRLGTGHVLFFYDKLAFIEKRYFLLKDEVLARGFNITPKDDIVDFRQVINARFYQDYTPDMDAVRLSIGRLIEKVVAKPNWYRLYGQLMDDELYCQKLQVIAC
ncbi:pyrimidine dimer DNA glycosylase/endonuclease V [Moraxella sp. FZLJ2107]|uniref:pyrimidine dimer DNA glycosylase/endonuclease V n=1 Tax=unclassified Moraxella TaxID=2685852 RepID=UPI0020C88E1E|nr:MULTISPECIES: pyrimidine dimer DNA glycosylase/endonuclease V [unclassified Moraxella]UTO05047.1 pyrimidine dimer DNA glycosylase/endonuclease V [Moraxella sp. FZLJ2107]UTO21782.1 pyrimidine dimer DNA glycosylase/endonuclease V [Moraxella sp. FZLJ2109]